MASENVIPPAPKSPRKHRGARIVKPALARIAERVLDVTDDEVRLFQPTELDLEICQAMVAGQITFTEIAEAVGVEPNTISRAMQDPVRCAWLSQTVHKVVARRIGLVDAALMRSAMGGNTASMKLYYERFGQLVHRSHVHHTGGANEIDYTQLTDAQLAKLAGQEADAKAVDAEYTVKGKGVTPDGPEST